MTPLPPDNGHLSTTATFFCPQGGSLRTADVFPAARQPANSRRISGRKVACEQQTYFYVFCSQATQMAVVAVRGSTWQFVFFQWVSCFRACLEALWFSHHVYDQLQSGSNGFFFLRIYFLFIHLTKKKLFFSVKVHLFIWKMYSYHSIYF